MATRNLAAILLCFQLIAGATCFMDDKSDWDYFTFTQEWPPTVCINGRQEHHRCDIPPTVTTWGVHGLWPTKKGTKGPEDCDPSAPFNEAAIKPLLSRMQVYWPNLYSDTSDTDFWRHEWTKHGTCSMDLDATRDEFHYFQKALDLHKLYNASVLLEKENITATDDQTYEYTSIVAALKRQLGGVTPVVECAYDNTNRHHVLYEVEICLDKNFQKMDCFDDNNSSGSHSHHSTHTNCPAIIYYPPIPALDFNTVG